VYRNSWRYKCDNSESCSTKFSSSRSPWVHGQRYQPRKFYGTAEVNGTVWPCTKGQVGSVSGKSGCVRLFSRHLKWTNQSTGSKSAPDHYFVNPQGQALQYYIWYVRQCTHRTDVENCQVGWDPAILWKSKNWLLTQLQLMLKLLR
jgi:hypothetical protein